MKLAKIHSPAHIKEPIWHVQAALLVAIALPAALNSQLVVGPKYLLAVLEGMLLLALSISGQHERPRHYKLRRLLALLLIGLVSIANITSLVLVTRTLLLGGLRVDGHELILSALAIYLTNIIIFGLLYWELDSHRTADTANDVRDFLFPQMTMPSRLATQPNWQPTFFDFLYVSVTNATAFSPTDAMPLTYRAKLLMSIQALTSLATIALVAARAVNILG